MAEPKQIDLYLAIEEMKRISAEGGTFSLRFRKWNRDTRRGGDMANFPRADQAEGGRRAGGKCKLQIIFH